MATRAKRLTLADLKRAAAKQGGTVEGGVIGRYASYHVNAPDRQVWCASGLHYHAVTWYATGPGGAPTWPEEKQDALADAIERVEAGAAACNDPGCDICNPETEAARG